MKKHFLQLRDVSAYRKALSIAQNVWRIVSTWDYFSRDTMGKQFVRSADSISANIAEGFGKYTKKDRVHYYHNAYGSMNESMDWLLKAHFRKKISDEEFKVLMEQLKSLPREIRALIHFTNTRLTI